MSISRQLAEILQELRVIRQRLDALERPGTPPPPPDSIARMKEMVLKGLE